MTDDSTERSYLLTLEGVIFVTMVADGNIANQAKAEIAQIVAAWWHGRIFPRREAPIITEIFNSGSELPEPPAAVEIAGGVSGLQKHVVARADANRGLDHAALKELFDEHQVVVAVWRSPDAPGMGFLTLKGAEYLFAQAKRGAKKVRVTMTAIPCTNKEHAELLQQAFPDVCR